jgi:glucose-6-phosphate 1-dehydrogenase
VVDSSVQANLRGPKGDALVIFGITGDLAKKMTFQSLYRLEARGILDVPVIGVARHGWTRKDLVERARSAIANTIDDPDEKVVEALTKRLD